MAIILSTSLTYHLAPKSKAPRKRDSSHRARRNYVQLLISKVLI